MSLKLQTDDKNGCEETPTNWQKIHVASPLVGDCRRHHEEILRSKRCGFTFNNTTLVNVYVHLLVFTRIAGTS